MNKRFSTLLAAALVAGGVSVFAQTKAISADDVWKDIKSGDFITLNDASNGMVELRDVEDGIIKTNAINTGNFTNLPLSKTFTALWKVEIIKSTSTAGWDTYRFVNKATQTPLAVELKTNGKDANGNGVSTTEVVLNEDGNDEWGWNSELGLYAVTSDSTFFLTVTSGTAYLTSVKGGVKEAIATKTSFPLSPFVVTPTAVSGSRELSANDFNYLVGSTGKLYFGHDKDVANVTDITKWPNILTAKTWEASPANNVAGDCWDNAKLFVLSSKADSTGATSDTWRKPSLLMVDTLMYDYAATSLNVLTIDTLKDKINYDANGNILNWSALELADGGAKQFTKGTGASAKTYAYRSAQTARFGGEYFFTNDSLVLKAKRYPVKTAVTGGTTELSNSTEYSGANAGQIALRVLNDNKIVLTPAPANTDLTTADKAKEANFKLPYIYTKMDDPEDGRTTQEDGLYKIKDAKSGKYLAVAINYVDSIAKWTEIDGDFQALDHMPAYQWVVLQNREGKSTSSIKIANREYPAKNTKDIQLMFDEDEKVYYMDGTKAIYVTFEEVADVAKSDTLLGYRNFDKDSLKVVTYTFNHFSPYDASHYIGVTADDDSTLTVKDYESSFKLAQLSDKAVKYGYNVTDAVAKRIPGLKNLYRNVYTAAVRDGSVNNGKNIFRNEDGKFAVDATAAAMQFYFKENNCDNGKHFYALIALSNDTTKAGVAENTKKAVLKAEEMANINTSVFAIEMFDAPLYRRFNTELEGVKDGKDVALALNFKEYYRGEYLMDENNNNFQDEVVDYLGIWTKDKATGLSFHVDTAWVNRGLGYIKPQYLISVDRDVIGKIDAEPCHLDHEHLNGITEWTCPHATQAKAGYTVAKYLVNFQDSVAAERARGVKDVKNPYLFGKYTRVGFEKALHIGDSLIFLVNGFEKVDNAKLDTAEIIKAYKAAKIDKTYIKDLAAINDNHQTYTWSFRYIKSENAAAATTEEEVPFLIESMAEEAIQPTSAAWLKSQDGCLVLSEEGESTFANAKTGGDNALIFNIELGSEDDMATDNEVIATSEVAVIAGEGQVTIAGAAGKKVVITNILGQTVANTVISSDNATIAAPAGVVVVAIEGEEAVKAIVK